MHLLFRRVSVFVYLTTPNKLAGTTILSQDVCRCLLLLSKLIFQFTNTIKPSWVWERWLAVSNKWESTGQFHLYKTYTKPIRFICLSLSFFTQLLCIMSDWCLQTKISNMTCVCVVLSRSSSYQFLGQTRVEACKSKLWPLDSTWTQEVTNSD